MKPTVALQPDPDIAPRPVRAQLKALTIHPRFQKIVIAAIGLNAIILGVETYPSVMASHGALLHGIDHAFLAFFVAELLLRIAAEPRQFFRDHWNVFDILIVAVSLLPFLGNLSALRALRVLRALRLLTTAPVFRRVLTGINLAICNSVPVAVVLAVIIYIYAVMGSKLFGAIDPAHFGDLDSAAFTLFQIMTLDAWNAIIRPIMEVHWYAGLFFISFVFIAVFILLSVVVGIAADAMNSSDNRVSNEDLLTQIEATRAAIERLGR